MATYIVLASALAVIQFWVIPFLINVKNINRFALNLYDAKANPVMQLIATAPITVGIVILKLLII